MAVKTRTVIIVVLAAFFVFFSLAAFLISRFLVEIKQSGPENAIFVQAAIGQERGL